LQLFFAIINGVVSPREFFAALAVAALCFFVAGIWWLIQDDAVDKVDKYSRKVLGGSWREVSSLK
jgi:hypothetical protein